MRILDMTAGNRAIWHNKYFPLCTYMDIRESVSPDVVHDIREPIPGGPYDLFVFDPPHANFGANGKMSKNYGHHTAAEIREIVSKGSGNAAAASRPNALMAFKWNNHDIKLNEVLSLMKDWQPLFGHLTKNGPRSQTYWVMLRRL